MIPVTPVWQFVTNDPWIVPGVYKAANSKEKVRHQNYLTQIVGLRDDGKYFYMNVTAPPKCSEARRTLILEEAKKEFVRKYTGAY